MAVERVEIEHEGSPWKEEHQSRYYHIRNMVQQKVVLDIACGTGFGSELLLQSGAAIVYAADVSQEALDACRQRLQKFESSRWVCEKQDGTNMNYPTASFDMVVSFETIEHIENYKGFLSEIYRVLKPGGILVLSTPNALVTNPSKGKPRNPYHVYEFDPAELRTLLLQYFSIELSAGQHTKPSYGVAPFLPSFNAKRLNARQRINFLYWRILLRMPSLLRNSLHKIFFSSSFYPAVDQYTFLPENLDKAHVQYHICRKTK